jgi:hypothetical protein
MRRYLVVANQTLGGDHLAQKVRECLAAGPCTFHIVVPATPPVDHTWTEPEARAQGQVRLDRALARFRELGAADADGEVGDSRPLDAIGDALSQAALDGRPFDEVILSTLPPGLSRWLKMDLPHQVRQAHRVDVTHIVGEAEPQG